MYSFSSHLVIGPASELIEIGVLMIETFVQSHVEEISPAILENMVIGPASEVIEIVVLMIQSVVQGHVEEIFPATLENKVTVYLGTANLV